VRRLAKLAAKIVILVLLGGFAGALLVRFAPGFGTDEAEMDTRLSSDSIQALRQANEDHSNFAVFYVKYLRRLLRGDLGESRTLQQPVAQLLRERLPETLKVVGIGLALGWSTGIALAVATTLARRPSLDIITGLLVGILLCLPAAVLALFFVLARIPAHSLLAVVILPKVYRYSRNLLASAAALPHVLTARAKGLNEWRVLVWHIFPVALPQFVALAGVCLSIAFTAAIPVEALCDIPGIGQLAWKAALGRDISLLVNLTILVTLITVVANSGSELIERSPSLEAA
jgi:peptide/nickel transport system permease protein